jgi:hypothetical protein
MNIVKCPNPSCPFQFDAKLVPAGAVIACPQCRLQFQLPQAAAPVPAPPVAAPVDDRRERTERRVREEPLVRSRRNDPPKRGSGAAVIALMVVGVAFLCCGGGVGVAFVLGLFNNTGRTADTTPYDYPEYALSYSGPGDGWAQDEDTRRFMRVKLACFKHESPEGYIAVEVQKSEGTAGTGGLLPPAKAVLIDHFDDVDEALTPAEATLLGAAAERYEFAGLYKKTGTGCRGQVHAVAVRNLKVWVYTWAERDRFEELVPAFDKFRAGMRLEGKATEPKIQKQRAEFRSPGGLYTLADGEGLWRRQDDPTLQDAAGDLWLVGSERVATTGLLQAKPSANLVVAVLDPKGDAKEQAKEHILSVNADGAEVDPLSGDPLGEAPSEGPVAASDAVVRFTMKYPGTTGSADKLVVYRVADSGGKRVVAYAWCELKKRDYWEQRLMLLVGTLKGLK